MEKKIAILNGQEVKEIKNPHASFEELLEGRSPNEIRVISSNGTTRIVDLEDKITDYLETRRIEMGGVPRNYKCLELELRQKVSFNEYCKKTSCLVVDRQIFELSKKKSRSVGKLNLLGETFYITEKSPNIEIEFDGGTLHELMTKNYFNYRGSMYELTDGVGEIELKGKQYKITNRKRGELATPELIHNQGMQGVKEYEIRYKETRTITITKKY